MKTTHTPEEIAKHIAELPEPLREKPKLGYIYYCPQTCGTITNFCWANDSTDNRLFASNVCFSTRSNAQAHADFRKWLYGKPKLTIEECYEKAIGLVNAPERFIQLARENGHL